MTKGFTTEGLAQLFKMFKDELKQKIDNVLLEIEIEPVTGGFENTTPAMKQKIADIVAGKEDIPNVVNLKAGGKDCFCTKVTVAYVAAKEKRLCMFVPAGQKLTDADGINYTDCWVSFSIQGDYSALDAVHSPLLPVGIVKDPAGTFSANGPVATIPCAENKHHNGLGLVKGAAPSASTNRTSANVYVVKQKRLKETPDGNLSALRYETVTFSLLGTAPQSFAKDSNCYVTGEAFIRHYYTSTAYTKVTPIVGNTYFDTAKKIAYVWTGEAMLSIGANSEKEPLVITLNVTENTGTKISAIANAHHMAIKQAMQEGRRCYWYAPQLNDAIAEVTGVQDAATGMIVYDFTDNGAVTMMFVRQQAQFVTVLIREL